MGRATAAKTLYNGLLRQTRQECSASSPKLEIPGIKSAFQKCACKYDASSEATSTSGRHAGLLEVMTSAIMRSGRASSNTTAALSTKLLANISTAAPRQLRRHALTAYQLQYQRQLQQVVTHRAFSTAPQNGPQPFKTLLQSYKQLSKARLSALVVLTAGAGFVAGSGDDFDWSGLLWTSLGTFGAAACANTLNQVGLKHCAL